MLSSAGTAGTPTAGARAEVATTPPLQPPPVPLFSALSTRIRTRVVRGGGDGTRSGPLGGPATASETPTSSSSNGGRADTAQRRVLRVAVEGVFCGAACCVRQQTDRAGVLDCLHRLQEHLDPHRSPVASAHTLSQQLPCPECVGPDGLCCSDARYGDPGFERLKLRVVRDLGALHDDVFQPCAVHTRTPPDSACRRDRW